MASLSPAFAIKHTQFVTCLPMPVICMALAASFRPLQVKFPAVPQCTRGRRIGRKKKISNHKIILLKSSFDHNFLLIEITLKPRIAFKSSSKTS